MVDIRDKKAMIARLREAQAGFEKGAPVPSAGGALLAIGPRVEAVLRR
jgi:hypothetical protein